MQDTFTKISLDVPDELLAQVAQAVALLDTDRAKFIRLALRNEVARTIKVSQLPGPAGAIRPILIEVSDAPHKDA